ncbi:tetraacyldisaccharide 4'-kinase [Leptobacterium sp. I13]|uniref:tetraacyldisaccharide 4'-kinase n=1 Tax=Leptobacterium meishanense TaxID=3128904 RepID=UPI0030EB44BE
MRRFRKILFPFSLLYGLIVHIRNYLYNKGILRSVSYGFPVLCVGNLSVGGTGKTPMVMYLVHLLKGKYRVAILSRGYKRKSKGFLMADKKTSVEAIGDEPFQYYNNFPEITVAVAEERVYGIQKLMELDSSPEIVVLDDAYQHRKVTPGLNILLTVYNSLYVNDLMLPTGNLRDSKKEAGRADIIVVTKCPKELSVAIRDEVIQELKIQPYQKVFFTTIDYSNTVLPSSNTLGSLKERPFVLVTGIANAAPMVAYLKSLGLIFKHYAYKDHHYFSDKEIAFFNSQAMLLTTEKDFMRLKDRVEGIQYLPIEIKFLFEEAAIFDNYIEGFVKNSL